MASAFVQRVDGSREELEVHAVIEDDSVVVYVATPVSLRAGDVLSFVDPESMVSAWRWQKTINVEPPWER